DPGVRKGRLAESSPRRMGEDKQRMLHRSQVMISLETILEGVDLLSPVPADVPVQAISADSRRIQPGTAFVAIPGLIHDGADFIPEAVRQGAAVIVCNGRSTTGSVAETVRTPVVQVRNPRQALSRMAANFYGHPSREMTMIGITGTNGKTTTAFLLNSILDTHGLKTGLMGTLGLRAPGVRADSILTTPDSLQLQQTLRFFLDGGITHVIMEVSSHALELNRVDTVEFDVAVFTNLSPEHLDFHLTMEDYFRAKARLFSSLDSGATAVLNGLDDRFESLRKMTPAKIVPYGSETSPVRFEQWGMSRDGIQGTVRVEKERFDIHSPLLGVHNLENILSSIAVAWSLGISIESIRGGIEACRSVPGRVERLTAPNGATVILDYAHTPDAYHKLLSSLKNLLPRNGRLWVIFGCGGDRDRQKRPLMAQAAEEYAHEILVTPDNPRTEPVDSINEDIKRGFHKNTHRFVSNRAKAIRQAIGQLKPDDILAIVGKGRENYQIVGGEKVRHSDFEVASQAIRSVGFEHDSI
ncbi:MAG: UDP-N-acetylmuramoyl-L-alanyl-D-glutamate--2,6-diaminopimelate ligase, partial [Fidelibacterota bacterium]